MSHVLMVQFFRFLFQAVSLEKILVLNSKKHPHDLDICGSSSCIVYKNSMFVTKTSRSTFGKCWLPWFIWARCGTFRYVRRRVQIERCMASHPCGFGRLDPWRNHFDYWCLNNEKNMYQLKNIKTRFFDMFWILNEQEFQNSFLWQRHPMFPRPKPTTQKKTRHPWIFGGIWATRRPFAIIGCFQ